MLPSQSHALSVRARLRNPPNAVHDDGINLKRPKEPKVVPIIEHHVAPTIVPVATIEPSTDLIELESWELAIEAMRERAMEMRAKLGLGDGPPRVTIDEILNAVCRKYRIKRLDLVSNRRTGDLIGPRHIAMYLAKTLTTRSLPEIGRVLGGRDHTTVLHGVRKITARREVDADLNADLEDFTKLLTA